MWMEVAWPSPRGRFVYYGGRKMARESMVGARSLQLLLIMIVLIILEQSNLGVMQQSLQLSRGPFSSCYNSDASVAAFFTIQNMRDILQMPRGPLRASPT